MDDTAKTLAGCPSMLDALSTYLLWGDDPDNITCMQDTAALLNGDVCTDKTSTRYNAYLLPILLADAETSGRDLTIRGHA